MPRLHRNNAAEWVMVVALTPVAWWVYVWRQLAGKFAKRQQNSDHRSTFGHTFDRRL